jgi:hypothetical protein
VVHFIYPESLSSVYDLLQFSKISTGAVNDNLRRKKPVDISSF